MGILKLNIYCGNIIFIQQIQIKVEQAELFKDSKKIQYAIWSA